MIDEDVVTDAVATRSPNDRAPVARERIAGPLQMRPVDKFKRDMVHETRTNATDKVHGVMVGAATQEREVVLNPIRDAKSEGIDVKIRHRFCIGDEKGEVTELARGNSSNRRSRAGVRLNIQFDRRVFWILEHGDAAQPRRDVAVAFVMNTEFR